MRIELQNLRTETSKTYDNFNDTKTLEAHVSPIHYKKNYKNRTEQWKDIDLNHTIDTPDYIEYDRLPSVVRIYKNKTGYEITSRKTGHKFKVELDEIDGVKKTKHTDDKDLEMSFEVKAFQVRLWKDLKTSKAPKNFKWKITEEKKSDKIGSLKFREQPEAIDSKGKQVEITTKKTTIKKGSFYWEEKSPKTGVKIDTDVSYYSGAGDGMVSNTGETSWNTCHDATAGDIASDDLNLTRAQAQNLATFYYIRRTFLPFNTSALPDVMTIVSAQLKLYCYQVGSGNEGTRQFGVVQTTQASTGSLVVGDFDQCGAINNPTEGASRQAITAIGWITWTLNSTGRGWISKTGWTKLGVRGALDMDDQVPSEGSQGNSVFFRTSEAVNDPILEITYNEPPTAPTSLYTEGATNPRDIQDSTPEFSAIFNDPDPTDTALYYQIQVDTDGTFTSPLWDSGKTALGAAVNVGSRCEDISYGGTALSIDGTRYYWRIKFWDDNDNEGSWSSSAYFDMDCTVTVEIQTDSAGDPSGTPVTNGTKSMYLSDIGESQNWISFVFDTPPSLTGSTQYHIVLKIDGLDNLVDRRYLHWSYTNTNPYANGMRKTSDDGGTTWTDQTSDDMTFKTYNGSTADQTADLNIDYYKTYL
jgi:hypothetical protein